MMMRRWKTAASEPAMQVMAFALLVILAIWFVLGHSLWVLRGQVEANARADTAALTYSLEAHLSSWLEKARLVVGRAADGVTRNRMTGTGIPPIPFDDDFAAHLVRSIDGVEPISGLGVFAADGIIRHAVTRNTHGDFQSVGYEMDVSDRDYVSGLETFSGQDLFIGRPVQSLAGGQWVLPVSRPIRDSVGALQGGVVALIDIHTLVALFEAVRPKGVDHVVVLRDDGVLMAHLPTNDTLLGSNLAAAPWVADILALPHTGTHLMVSRDGEHLRAMRHSPTFPLVLVAGMPVDHVLLPWYTALYRSLAIGGAVATVVGLLALILAAQWRRREATEAALRASRRALQSSLDRFERAVAGSTAAMWEFDIRDGTGYLAPQWDDLLGWHEVDQPYLFWRDHLHPDDRARVLAALDAHLTRRVPFDTEYRLRAADGTWRWVKARGQASWAPDGSPTIVSGTVHDITNLRQSEERLRLALEATHDGLWDWEVSSGRLFFSQSWKVMLGYPPEAPLRQHIRTVARLLHPEDRPTVLAWMRGLMAGAQEVGQCEHRLRDAAGVWIWVRAAAKVTERDPAGRPLRIVGTHQDVTHRRAELRQLQDARRQAEEGSRAKSEFLATMSHELRTPLNAISGFSESLECQFFGPLNAKQMEYVGDIRASADHLTSLISDILDMAKIEAGHTDLYEEPVDIAAAVRAKTQMVRHRTEEKGIDLIEDLEPLPPYLMDARRFGQMVLNLLSNAIKFTPQGGTITIRTDTDPDGELTVSVIDTGIGIAAEDLDRVLEPFTQVDSRLSREYEGTGLGLPLVKAMAEMHGGALTLNSVLGRGTTAMLRFPAFRRQSGAAAPSATEEIASP